MPAGRPKIDEALRIQRQLWLHHVERLSKLTHYEMDSQFDLDYDKKNMLNLTSDKRRRKLFEDLKIRNVMPFRTRRKEFIQKVAAHPRLHKTAIVYESLFWKFVQKEPLSIKENRQLIVDLLDSNSLLEEPGTFNLEKDAKRQFKTFTEQYGLDKSSEEFRMYQYKAAFGEIFAKTYFELDQLAIVGAFALEHYLIGNYKIAIFLKALFFEYLEEIIDKRIVIPESLKVDFINLCEERVGSLFNDNPFKDLKGYADLIPKNANRKSAAALLLYRQEMYVGMFDFK